MIINKSPFNTIFTAGKPENNIMDKRTFLKKGTILGIGGVLAGGAAGNIKASGILHGNFPGEEPYKLPDPGYPYDALEPHIDAMTMEIHHSKHHAGYTRKFNAAVKDSGLGDSRIKDIFDQVSRYPAGIRNNGGGFYNHKLFWNCMSPRGGGEPKGELLKAIERNFGSFEKFREAFSMSAATRFGSGWAWLIKTVDGLKVSSTPNQDNPLMDVAGVRGFPLLGIDVWEHAYYLKYQNRRKDYIAAFWNVVNWDFVAERFNKSGK
jgi:Fe-Mn family superoxide dismutase